jgi:hypothetical protein
MVPSCGGNPPKGLIRVCVPAIRRRRLGCSQHSSEKGPVARLNRRAIGVRQGPKCPSTLEARASPFQADWQAKTFGVARNRGGRRERSFTAGPRPGCAQRHVSTIVDVASRRSLTVGPRSTPPRSQPELRRIVPQGALETATCYDELGRAVASDTHIYPCASAPRFCVSLALHPFSLPPSQPRIVTFGLDRNYGERSLFSVQSSR